MSQRKLAPTVLGLLDKPAQDRIDFIKMDRWIGYPTADRILDKMEDIYSSRPRKRVKNLLVVGDPNAGKSTLKERFMDKYPSTEAEDDSHTISPLLHIEAPSEADPLSFLIEILDKFGEDIPKRPTFGVLAVQVIKVLSKAKVKVIIVDEVHNFLEGRKDMRKKLLNQFRKINNTLKISFFFFGIPTALQVISGEPQLSSRFEREFMPKWDASGNEKFLVKMLKALEMTLPLMKPSNLHEKEIKSKIIQMSEGILGEIVEIVEKAAIYAIKNKDEAISLRTLAAIEYLTPTQRLKYACNS